MKQDIAIVWDLNGVLFKNLTLDARTFEIVEKLNSINVSQYVCTNTRVWKLDKWIEEFNLGRHFKKIFSSKRMGLLKSNPLVYEYILKEIHESNLYFIDDSIKNIRVAESFNINCIQYKSDLQLKTDLKLLGIYNDN
jgi:FMN phosphatase YigB (HAD superfamily)